MKYSDYNLQLLRVLNCRSILHLVKKQVQQQFRCTAVSSEDSSATKAIEELKDQLLMNLLCDKVQRYDRKSS